MTKILTLFILLLEYWSYRRLNRINESISWREKGLGNESKDRKALDSKRNIMELQRVAKLWAYICLSETLETYMQILGNIYAKLVRFI